MKMSSSLACPISYSKVPDVAKMSKERKRLYDMGLDDYLNRSINLNTYKPKDGDGRIMDEWLEAWKRSGSSDLFVVVSREYEVARDNEKVQVRGALEGVVPPPCELKSKL